MKIFAVNSSHIRYVLFITLPLLFVGGFSHAAINIGDGTINVDVGSNSNTPEAAVANALAIICPDHELAGQLGQVCDYLNNNDETGTADLYRALSARLTSALTSLAAHGPASLGIDDFSKRLAALRRGSRKLSLAGLSVNYNGMSVPVSSILAAMFVNEAGAASADASSHDQRLSGFISGALAKSEQTETDTLAGFEANNNGLTVGVDYRFQDNLFAGVATRYLSGDLDLDRNGGSVDMDDLNITFYGTYYPHQDFYVDAMLYAAQGEFDIKRKIEFTLDNNAPACCNEVANASTDGNRWGISVGAGYEQYFKALNITGLFDANLHYSTTDIDRYDESGGNGFDLQVQDQSIDSLILRIGAQFSKSINMASGVIIPMLAINIKHEFEDDGEEIRASFADDPSNQEFAFTTDKRDTDFLDVNLGATLILPGGLSGFAQYEYTAGIDDYDQAIFSIGARMEF